MWLKIQTEHALTDTHWHSHSHIAHSSLSLMKTPFLHDMRSKNSLIKIQKEEHLKPMKINGQSMAIWLQFLEFSNEICSFCGNFEIYGEHERYERLKMRLGTSIFVQLSKITRFWLVYFRSANFQILSRHNVHLEENKYFVIIWNLKIH